MKNVKLLLSTNPLNVKKQSMIETRRVSRYMPWLLLMLSLAGFKAQALESVTVRWDSIEGAVAYRLEERIGDGEFVEVTTDATVLRSFDREIDVYAYRVIACVNGPTGEQACDEEYASYSDIVELDLANPVTRRVIFIHTDALGSPVAETDEGGVKQ